MSLRLILLFFLATKCLQVSINSETYQLSFFLSSLSSLLPFLFCILTCSRQLDLLTLHGFCYRHTNHPFPTVWEEAGVHWPNVKPLTSIWDSRCNCFVSCCIAMFLDPCTDPTRLLMRPVLRYNTQGEWESYFKSVCVGHQGTWTCRPTSPSRPPELHFHPFLTFPPNSIHFSLRHSFSPLPYTSVHTSDDSIYQSFHHRRRPAPRAARRRDRLILQKIRPMLF